MKNLTKALLAAPVALTLIAAPAAFAATTTTTTTGLTQPDNLPDGKDVIERGIEAIGGKRAYRKLENIRQTGRLETAGISGSLKIVANDDDNVRVTIDIPGFDQVITGVSGGVAYRTSITQGAQVLEGKEAESQIEEADFFRAINPWDFIESAETVAAEDVDGEKCYKVRLELDNGDEQTRWYSAETGLLRKSQSIVPQAGQMINTTTVTSDYREVEGVLFPHRLDLSAGGLPPQSLIMDKIEANVDLDSDALALPDDVQALVK
ncbi:MAG: hypothetical protein AAGI17_11265 [Planctomycetota bacterium]